MYIENIEDCSNFKLRYNTRKYASWLIVTSRSLSPVVHGVLDIGLHMIAPDLSLDSSSRRASGAVTTDGPIGV